MIHDTLTEAVKATSADPKRIYRVRQGHGTFRFVVSVSPAAAALEVVGEENVELVSQRERGDATAAALAELLKSHNAELKK